MRRFTGALLGVFVLAIFVGGCAQAVEGDPRTTQPSSTPGTTAGTNKATPGGTPTPGQDAGASGTGTTAPSTPGG